jgi:uncharacterized protein (DUF58 family)
MERTPVQASIRQPIRSFLDKIRTRLKGLVQLQRPESRVDILLEQKALAYVFLLALAWYIISPNLVSTCAAAALGGLLLAAYLWARAMAVYVSARRKLHYSAFQVGDELEEIITVSNTSWLPLLWVQFSDHSDLPGYAISGVRGADAYSKVNWRFHTTCTRRGVYTLGPWELVLGEPFGIFKIIQHYTHSQEILVYPPLAHIPRHLLPHSSAFGDQRTSRYPLQDETILAFTTRPYAPGDPLRHVHWPTSAHRNQTYVKQFDPLATSAAWLVPDFDDSVHMNLGDDSSLESMIILLASLADWLLREQFAVGFYAHEHNPQLLRPQRGKNAFWNLLRTIAPMYTVPNRPFAETLREVRPLLGLQDMLLVVTPSLDPAWARELRKLSNQRRIHAFMLDPAGYGGQPARPYVQMLASLGVTSSLLQPGDIQSIPGSYGALRRWEFRTLSTGRVILVQTPRQAASKPNPGEQRHV